MRPWGWGEATSRSSPAPCSPQLASSHASVCIVEPAAGCTQGPGGPAAIATPLLAHSVLPGTPARAPGCAKSGDTPVELCSACQAVHALDCPPPHRHVRSPPAVQRRAAARAAAGGLEHGQRQLAHHAVRALPRRGCGLRHPLHRCPQAPGGCCRRLGLLARMARPCLTTRLAGSTAPSALLTSPRPLPSLSDCRWDAWSTWSTCSRPSPPPLCAADPSARGPGLVAAL